MDHLAYPLRHFARTDGALLGRRRERCIDCPDELSREISPQRCQRRGLWVTARNIASTASDPSASPPPPTVRSPRIAGRVDVDFRRQPLLRDLFGAM
jgi:hypothetical protein